MFPSHGQSLREQQLGQMTSWPVLGHLHLGATALRRGKLFALEDLDESLESNHGLVVGYLVARLVDPQEVELVRVRR